MGNDDPSFFIFPQSAYDIFIGKTMKSLAVYAFMPETAHDRQPLGHFRYLAVKRSVKTDDLAESRVVPGYGFNAFDLAGQVQRGQWDKASQGEHQFGCHHFRRHVLWPAMDNLMSHAIRSRKMLRLHGRGEHCLDSLVVVGEIRVTVHQAFSLAIFQPELSTGKTDPFHRPFGNEFLGFLEMI